MNAVLSRIYPYLIMAIFFFQTDIPKGEAMKLTRQLFLQASLAVMPAMGFLTMPALAEMGPKPSFPDTVGAEPGPQPGKIVARVDLQVGSPLLMTGPNAQPLRVGQMLGPDSVIKVPAGARVRIGFPNGDALHLGEGTLLALRESPKGWLAQVWEGALTLYASPNARGRGTLETPFGSVDAGEGKLGLVLPGAGAGITVYAFNNWRAWERVEKEAAYRVDAAGQDWRIDAAWRGKGKDQAEPLVAGRMLQLEGDSARVSALDPDIEIDLTHVTSPEGMALRKALDARAQGDNAQARTVLAQVQRSFPRNGQAAYFLGLIALEGSDNFEAIRQWQQYIQIDPEGAAQQGIPERVTLLLNEEMREEIRAALKQEANLSNSQPEPGTVAVLPFANRGDQAQAVLSKGLTAMIVSDLSKVPGIRVLEREKMQKLADEIALSQSGLVDEKDAVRAGRLMRAEKLMIGDYKIQEDGK